jgi:hypothetical protein
MVFTAREKKIKEKIEIKGPFGKSRNSFGRVVILEE